MMLLDEKHSLSEYLLYTSVVHISCCSAILIGMEISLSAAEGTKWLAEYIHVSIVFL